MEVVLDRLQDSDERMLIQACADDTAMVEHDVLATRPKLARLFTRLENVSGLRLNAKNSITMSLNNYES